MKKESSVTTLRALGLIAFIAIMGISMTSCLSWFYDEGFNVKLPEAWAPDPDKTDDKMVVDIFYLFPKQPKGEPALAAKEWTIRIQPVIQRAEGEGGQQRQAGEGGQRRRRAFFEETGTGTPPRKWYWDGKGSNGRMAQSAQTYQFSMTLTDTNDVEYTFEKNFEMDLLVIRDGEDLRIVVPSITFKPSSPDLVSEGQEARTNTRVLNLIVRALTKFGTYSVTVEGYSNPTTQPGTAEREQEIEDDIPLTEGRANAVVAYLTGTGGISQDRLHSVGRGCANPSIDMDNENFEEENWQNRRVEFLLHKN